MDDEALESKRTAIALVRLSLEKRDAEWLALARGTEDPVGAMVTLSSIAAILTEIVSAYTGKPALQCLDDLARAQILPPEDDR